MYRVMPNYSALSLWQIAKTKSMFNLVSEILIFYYGNSVLGFLPPPSINLIA